VTTITDLARFVQWLEDRGWRLVPAKPPASLTEQQDLETLARKFKEEWG
jgi:hypothetical protein